MDTKTYTCTDCGGQFAAEPVINPFTGKELLALALCESCLKKRDDAESDAKKATRQKATQDAWEAICPPLYRQTDPKDTGLSRCVREALIAWKPTDSRGLGIIGRTGTGKTRLTFLKLQELHFEGVPIMATTAKRMERHIFDCYSDEKFVKQDARSIVDRARAIAVLFIDDVGKEKFTERVSGEFYDLIESRTANLLPTLWTANAAANDLVSRMGGEYGEPTVRRLIEFSTIIEA